MRDSGGLVDPVISSLSIDWTGALSSSDTTTTASSSSSSDEISMTSSGWTAVVDFCTRRDELAVAWALPEELEGEDSGSNRDDSLVGRDGAIGVHAGLQKKT